eukprot:ANDGO_06392.mRNA.1 hypothetical protein
MERSVPCGAYIFLLLLLLMCLTVIHGLASASVREVISALHSRVSEARFKRDTQAIFPVQWLEMKGLYPSFVHFNFAGNDVDASMLRRDFKILDNNAFVASFVLDALLQAHALGTITLQEEEEVLPTIQSILSFKDKNMPNPNVPLFSFWPQKLQTSGNKTAFAPWATNLAIGFQEEGSISGAVHKVLIAMGAANLWEKYFEPLQESMESMRDAFAIPADADDSGCNLALGSRIYALGKAFPSSSALWRSNTKDWAQMLQKITDVAWIPQSSKIDPRSYFLYAKYLSEDPDTRRSCRYVSTWAMSFAEDAALHPVLSMPFQVNNVDLAVTSNFLFGSISRILDEDGWVDVTNDTLHMIGCSFDLVSWAVLNKVPLERPDLALVYYPSLFDFYYFLGRLVRLVSTNPLFLKAPSSVKSAAYAFADVARSVIADQLADSRKTPSEGFACWDDFLGNADTPIPHYDDRLFSSALALSALIDSWAVSDASLRSDTPEVVVQMINQSAFFIQESVLSGSLKLENAFFSGSAKGMSSLPFWYPMTYSAYLNGTHISPEDISSITDELVCAVDSFVSWTDYSALLSKEWFGQPVPSAFPGYNSDSFPFWSSPVLTEAISLMALSKYAVLVDSHHSTSLLRQE